MTCDHPATDIYGRCTYCCEMQPTGAELEPSGPDLERIFDTASCTALYLWALGQLSDADHAEMRTKDPDSTARKLLCVEMSLDMLLLEPSGREAELETARLEFGARDWTGPHPLNARFLERREPPDAGPLSARF